MRTKITKRDLEEKVIGFDGVVVRRKAGEVKFGRGYFYRHGQTAEKFAACMGKELEKEFPGRFRLKDCGDHWAAFRGGASLWMSSHFWVVFSVDLVDQQTD